MSQEMPRDTVGWIGTGRMGFAMAGRLADAGAPLKVWNRTRAKSDPLQDRGAEVVDQIADLRAQDVVFTMVSTPADLEEVLLGESGLLADAGQLPQVVVDCSTVSTESSARIRSACDGLGVHFVASPVSGNGKVAETGRLSLVASGPEEAYQRVHPLLAAIGQSVTYAGDGDTARLVKRGKKRRR